MILDDVPNLVHTWRELDQVLDKGPRTVVMTMGALHQGHLDLIDRAGEFGGQIVVTIFVNPLQFGPNEDFEAYPRTLAADVEALAGRGVSVVYAPTVPDMYPGGKPAVTVAPGALGEIFEGAVRPGHFAGVLTVVHKLLSRTGATTALFGQKDAQQLALVRQMVDDLDLGCRVVAVPTRREADGLAMSSRNRYLHAGDRELALVLPNALAAAEQAGSGGAGAARAAAQAVAAGAHPEVTWDYLEIVDPASFAILPDDAAGPGLVIGAIRLAGTRLIDNRPLSLGV